MKTTVVVMGFTARGIAMHGADKIALFDPLLSQKRGALIRPLLAICDSMSTPDEKSCVTAQMSVAFVTSVNGGPLPSSMYCLRGYLSPSLSGAVTPKEAGPLKLFVLDRPTSRVPPVYRLTKLANSEQGVRCAKLAPVATR